jgi:hypothetical protein
MYIVFFNFGGQDWQWTEYDEKDDAVDAMIRHIEQGVIAVMGNDVKYIADTLKLEKERFAEVWK